MVGLVLNDMSGGGGSGDWVLRLAAVEVAVAATGGAFEGCWVSGGGRRGGHELAAAVQSMAS
jgi:hypothetical protein